MSKQWCDTYWHSFFKDAHWRNDEQAVKNGFDCISCYEDQTERLTAWWSNYLKEQEGE